MMAKDKNQAEIVENVNSFSNEEEDYFDAEAYASQASFRLLQEKEKKRKKLIKIGSIIALVLVMIIAGSVIYLRNKNKVSIVSNNKEVSIKIPVETDHIFVNDVSGVLPEKPATDEAGPIDNFEGLAGRSENFLMKEVEIGGESMILSADNENLALEIFDVHTESLMSNDGKQMKLLISWKSNKLSKASVSYAISGASDEKSLSEEGYGFSHALVMNKLELATRYSFTVRAVDRYGNKSNSDTFVTYTGIKPVSVFDLISGEFNKMFSWIIK